MYVVAARTFLVSLLLGGLLVRTTQAQNICDARETVTIKENNLVGDLVETIRVNEAVTLSLETSSDNSFTLNGNRLLAAKVLDYETSKSHVVNLVCLQGGTGLQLKIVIAIIVINVNDNPPTFGANPYQINVNELIPLNTPLDEHFPATDKDENTELYYTLVSNTNYFKLESPTNPELVIQNVLDYDKVKRVEMVLYAQDTPLAESGGKDSFTATTTIQVTVIDVDNRPPWFWPCTVHIIAGASICQSAGYTSRVVLNEMEAEPLTLKPGPLHAIDGDTGINEAIRYSFLSGNEDGLFEINPITGNITMSRAADVGEPISLTVVAAQTPSSSQFSTTSLTISVQIKSLHRPQFQRVEYEGVVSSVGAMATDPANMDEPLRLIALDEDYAALGGVNPNVVYHIKGSDDFSIINGYLFMTKNLPVAQLALQVEAVDTTNDDKATAQLSVEVKSGLTTTALPLSTTDIITTEEAVSTPNPTTPTDGSISTASSTSEGTTDSSMSTEGTSLPTSVSPTNQSFMSTTDSLDTGPTTNSSLTSEGSTAHPHTEGVKIPSGDFRTEDMAALGATLGILLFVCLVVISMLVCRLQRGKSDWRKIHEASVFRSSLGQGSGGQKEGIQYTNEAFEHDEDGGSVGSGGPDVEVGEELQGGSAGFALKSAAALSSLLDDDLSLTGSDKADSEKEVKPILTKERRMEEGYKAVWFKEDIDPNAKEEVVIIPDSREGDSEDEEDDRTPTKMSKVGFGEADLDSGLGVKMEDPAEDSEGDEVLDVDL
ncbi:cadherin-related family member 5 isoform X1 [Entelurus aequoreus]|uniref:cadherin-related family member 5 isoform X1 n=1 Tax=Entelurus aequoreus TaxID=161455 RepID=UPI002B1D9512|nr:cadherin-related family member 5 isoform X1 [Entelurus aequoreus]